MTPPAPPALTAQQCRVGESMADDYFQHAADCPECEAYEAARVATIRAAAMAAPPPDARLVALVREWRDTETAIDTAGQAGDMDAMQAASDRYDELHEKLRTYPLPARPTETPT